MIITFSSRIYKVTLVSFLCVDMRLTRQFCRQIYDAIFYIREFEKNILIDVYDKYTIFYYA